MTKEEKLRKVLELVAEYNRIAKKHGHPQIRYNVFKHILCDVYRRKSWLEAKTTWEWFKTMYFNWRLDRLYDRIWNVNMSLLSESTAK